MLKIYLFVWLCSICFLTSRCKFCDKTEVCLVCVHCVPLKLHGLSVSYLLTYFCKYFQLRATSWACINNFLILHDLCDPDQIGFVFAILNWIFDCQIVSDIFISQSNIYGQQAEVIGRGGGCLLVIVEVWSWQKTAQLNGLNILAI